MRSRTRAEARVFKCIDSLLPDEVLDPVDLVQLGEHLGASIAERDLSKRGRVVTAPNGRSHVLVDRHMHYREKRFVIAHELGHVLLRRLKNIDSSAVEALKPQEVERLCNRAAARILIPQARLKAGAQGPARTGLALGEMLARRLQVSEVVALRRLIDEFGELIALGFHWRERPGKGRKLRLMWSYKPAAVEEFIPHFKPPSNPDSIFHRATREDRKLCGWEDLSDFNLWKRDYFTEVRPINRGVLAVVNYVCDRESPPPPPRLSLPEGAGPGLTLLGRSADVTRCVVRR